MKEAPIDTSSTSNWWWKTTEHRDDTVDEWRRRHGGPSHDQPLVLLGSPGDSWIGQYRYGDRVQILGSLEPLRASEVQAIYTPAPYYEDDLTVAVSYEQIIPLAHPIEKAVAEAGRRHAAVGGFLAGVFAGFLLAALVAMVS